ncbi:MAG: L,D-transpeptidase family protein, partial [Myxococcota bacterium]
ENELEVWARGFRQRFVPVARYGICYASGELGPKRKQGDLQVPEGFYTLPWFDPASRYHLAMLVSYPSRSDKVWGDRVDPGDGIMIHGSCVSVGCISMSDARIEELWTMARASPKPIRVHMFPARDMGALLDDPKWSRHHAFWRNLDEGKRYFETHRRLPRVRVDNHGRYRFLSHR